MKPIQKLSKLFCLAALSCICYNAKAVNETEPNAAWNQAKNIPAGQTGIGKCAPGGDNDWWRITRTTDGNLEFAYTITGGNAGWLEFAVYDTLGTIQLNSGINPSVFSGLRAGSYYVRVHTYSTTDSANYTLAPIWTNAPLTNDVEPNSAKATAKAIPVNGSKTGHIGYYYYNSRDTADWYKITTTANGNLSVTLAVQLGNNVSFDFYDNNGTTWLDGNVTYNSYTINRNGLAPGTYYIRVTGFSSNDFDAYTVSNALTPSPVVNDTEPNQNKATAKVINVNDSVTGNLGYYYNLQRDSSDWYKVTTASDGDLFIKFKGFMGVTAITCTLFDNNGTTVLNSLSSYSNTLFKRGLGAGTYYIKFNMTNASLYAPYSVKVTLELQPPVTNDVEPNNSAATAKTINQNDSVKGHVGYYYQLKRDSTDWYKVVTDDDGRLSLQIAYQVNTGTLELVITIFDTNGSSVLSEINTTGNTNGSGVVLERANLKKGTYYIRIRPNYTTGYNWYSLKSTLISPLANDPEPNDYAAKGGVINGYTSKTGHVGYYGNGTYDQQDWWRIAFGGVGSLDVTIAMNTYFFAIYELYADTNATPIDNQIPAGTYSNSYTGLAAGTYYIKVWIYQPFISGHFGDYTLTANYRDTTSATITYLTSSNTAGSCNAFKINYYITRGLPPYSVQLYRNGVAYGSPVTTNDTAKFTALTPDVYYAKVKSTGAVTTTKQSGTNGLVTTVTGHTSSNIQSTSAVINWNAFSCVDGFQVSVKKTADPTFTAHQLAVGSVSDTLKNLLASTSYDYKVQAFVQYNGIKYYSGFTSVKSFTTLAPRLGGDEVQQLAGEIGNLLIYPNPAQNELNIQFEGKDGNASVKIIDLTGRIVMEKQAEVTLNQFSGILNISNLQSGIYQLTIADADNKTITTKVVKE